MRLIHSLSFKVIAIVFIALFIVMSGVSYLHIEAQSSFLEHTIYNCAERASALSKRAFRHGMQENDRLDIIETISDLSRAPGIDAIRIYDKTGRIAYSSMSEESGKTVNMKDDACTMCHGEGSEFTQTESNEYVRIYSSPAGHRVLGLITPINNDASCATAECHAHSPEQTVLGVLDVQMSLEEIDEQVSTYQNFALLTSLLTFLILGAATGRYVYHSVQKPVNALIEGTTALSSGNLAHRIELERRDELGDLVKAFNGMADDLDRAKSQLLDWSTNLETKVTEKTQQLNRVQAQILHMEKMASLGKLSSVIAHELNNPLAGILTYAKLIQRRLDRGELSEEKCIATQNEISLIADEARRCGDIVKNLLFFARGRESVFKDADVVSIIDKSIKLVQHKISLHEIHVEVHAPAEPLVVRCDENQVQQAVLAIMMNAIEAMTDGGRLGLSLAHVDSTVKIKITDTGMGISEANRQKIFEPFFTTKEEGYGTGLGLSIVYGIARRHEGTVTVDSEPGKGSTFTITLPQFGPTTEVEEENA